MHPLEPKCNAFLILSFIQQTVYPAVGDPVGKNRAPGPNSAQRGWREDREKKNLMVSGNHKGLIIIRFINF